MYWTDQVGLSLLYCVLCRLPTILLGSSEAKGLCTLTNYRDETLRVNHCYPHILAAGKFLHIKGSHQLSSTIPPCRARPFNVHYRAISSRRRELV
jgi:hypothetical protein